MSSPVPIPFNGWPKGVDNVHESFELADGALRSAVNMDILDSGKVRTRLGSTLAVAATAAHSVWSHHSISGGFYVAGTTLYSLSESLVSAAVVTGLAAETPVAYVPINGEVFWSNGQASGKIVNGVNYPAGVETPAKVAQLGLITGSLPAGRYQVTTTFRTASGEEGGAQNSEAITLSATGGISLTNMPLPQSGAVITRLIYMTSTNGDVMYKVAALPAATTSCNIPSMPVQTIALRTMDTQTMPHGTILAHKDGILYVAVGNAIYHSEPMRYGQCNITKNFYLFSKPVDVMLAAPEGLYVCADKTYRIESPGTAEVHLKTLLPFGGVKGTGVYMPDSTDVAWFSKRGQVVATAGQVAIPAEKLYVPDIMSSGASMVREQNGVRQIVNVANTGESSTLKSTGA